jgi:hypothetical protein
MPEITNRSPVAVIPGENRTSATYVLCDDGSLWSLHLGGTKPTWTALDAPLPGSLAAQGWVPRKTGERPSGATGVGMADHDADPLEREGQR